MSKELTKSRQNGDFPNSLTRAGDEVRELGIAEFGASLGGVVLLHELSNQLDAKRLQLIARIKREKLYERLGFQTWDE